MANLMTKIWDRLFLEERSSISFSFFRLAVAFTVGSVVIPTLFNLKDNYFATAFKTYNTSFFPIEFLQLVQRSSDGVVLAFVIAFYIFWFCFFIGLFSQISCILMTLCCYYFYALNSFHVGTLTWDILLVTLFLMCVTPYHGDYFSLDALRRSDEFAYKRKRPYFLQRLLQMQIASTYFYTALFKLPPIGNWITGNPIYYLMNDPPSGVTKLFLLRDFMADQPLLCYWAGIVIIVMEFLLPILLFVPKTRISAIYLGCIFHLTLILTLDVPATFFFLFPAQMLLFINPNNIERWIEQKRAHNKEARQSLLVYDGNCHFCQKSIAKLRLMDLFSTLEMVDYQRCEDIKVLHPDLTREQAASQLHLIEPDGSLYGGYHVFRRICLTMPMLYPFIFVFYFPGAGVIGPIVYKWVANNRYLLHFNKQCSNNTCFR